MVANAGRGLPIVRLRRGHYGACPSDLPVSAHALQWIADVPLLDVDDAVRALAELLVRERVMPAPVAGDAVHVAVACVHAVEYILSWNVRHLANPNKVAHLRAVCIRAGYHPPAILTPDLLWETTDEAATGPEPTG